MGLMSDTYERVTGQKRPAHGINLDWLKRNLNDSYPGGISPMGSSPMTMGPQSPMQSAPMPGMGGFQMPSVSAFDEGPIIAPNGPAQPPQESPGILQQIGNAATKYGPLALAGLSAFEGYRANKRSEELMKRAIQEEEEKKKMIAAGRVRRAGMQPRDLSPMFASDNPYAR